MGVGRAVGVGRVVGAKKWGWRGTEWEEEGRRGGSKGIREGDEEAG